MIDAKSSLPKKVVFSAHMRMCDATLISSILLNSMCQCEESSTFVSGNERYTLLRGAGGRGVLEKFFIEVGVVAKNR